MLARGSHDAAGGCQEEYSNGRESRTNATKMTYREVIIATLPGFVPQSAQV